MSRFIVSIQKGKFVVSGQDLRREFSLRDAKGLKELFENFRVQEVSCSSSVDFPQEAGAPKGFTGKKAHDIIQKALSWEDPEGYALIRKGDLKRIRDLAKEKGFLKDLKALEITTRDYLDYG